MSDRMVKDPKVLQDFYEELVNSLLEKGKEEIEQLADMKQKTTGDPNAKIFAWDKSFYNNLMKHDSERGGFVDEEKLKEYLPTEYVIPKCMEIFEEMLKVKFEKVTDNSIDTWHEEVEVHTVQC